MSTTQEDIAQILQGKPKLVHPLWSKVGADYDRRIVEKPESGVWVPSAHWDALPARIEVALYAALRERDREWVSELNRLPDGPRNRSRGTRL